MFTYSCSYTCMWVAEVSIGYDSSRVVHFGFECNTFTCVCTCLYVCGHMFVKACL